MARKIGGIVMASSKLFLEPSQASKLKQLLKKVEANEEKIYDEDIIFAATMLQADCCKSSSIGAIIDVPNDLYKNTLITALLLGL